VSAEGFAIQGAVLLAKIAVTLAAALGGGMLATDATAATLSVSVSPARLHPGLRYVVTITGRYNRRARPRPLYLLAFIQYNGKACQPTATAEYDLPTSEWGWDFYPQQAEASSPFKAVNYWKAGTSLGRRRLCAYLYASQVTPSTTAKPLLTASTAFRNVRR
jgi:hypothetical protein